MEDEKEEIKSVKFISPVTGLHHFANGSIGMKIRTPPLLDPDSKTSKNIIKLNNVDVAVGLVPINNPDAEVIDIPSPPKKGKYTKSQNLRFKIRDLWESEGEPGKWDDYYDDKMDSLIKFITGKIK